MRQRAVDAEVSQENRFRSPVVSSMRLSLTLGRAHRHRPGRRADLPRDRDSRCGHQPVPLPVDLVRERVD